jgi:hypothetical protein
VSKASSGRLTSSSLAALVHPAALAAIAILVLNDHFLKYAVPSWLTGKLSDFAGLYFAPYVCLAAVFAVLSRGRGFWTGRPIAMATYCTIALLFTILKTSADASHEVFVVSGQRISFVTDPTDLLALLSLPISYAMWAREMSRERRRISSPRRVPRMFAWCLAGIAIVATSSPPQPSITSVAVDRIDGGQMYAVLEYAAERNGVYVSRDAGSTWSRTTAATGVLVADPVESGIVYLVESPGSQSGLLRVSVPRASAEEIGPYARGNRYTERFGLTYLQIGAWPSPVLYFVRNGDLWTSSDGGAIWQNMGLEGPVYAVAPATTPNLVYAATNGYFMRSVDGGRVWTDTTAISGVPGDVSALVVHHDDPQLLFAGIGKTLRRSTDGGLTWQTRLQYGGSTSVDFAHWIIVLDPRDPDRAYALFGGGCCAPVISTDRGLTWKEWGDAVITIVPSGDPGHPLLALPPSRTRVLRHAGPPPGTWERVGETLPLGR